MKQFIDKTIKPFLIIMGLGTCGAGLLAFAPQIALEQMWKLPFNPDYVIFIRHWGFVIAMSGVFMIVAAFNLAWRPPVLTLVTFSKSFYAFLYIVYINSPFSKGFLMSAIMDAVIVAYILLYFIAGRENQ